MAAAGAIGSVVERFVHTEEVTGSNPVSPTGTTGQVDPWMGCLALRPVQGSPPSAVRESHRTSVVATDGMVTDRPYPETRAALGGFAVVDVSTRQEALEWAVEIALACRCAQEVRELLPDPTV